jgi:hypothetical protein
VLLFVCVFAFILLTSASSQHQDGSDCKRSAKCFVHSAFSFVIFAELSN